MLHFLVFGSHPVLSLAEAKALLGGDRPNVIGPVAFFHHTDWDGNWLQERLAGTVKLGDMLFSCPLSELTAEKIVERLPTRTGENKLTFAITVYGKTNKLKHLPIEVKQALRARGRSVRWFADKDGEVSPAAVAKLNLTTEGYDLAIVVEHETAHVGLTTNVQNANAWSQRDYGRPARDAKNGMLPPKLARVMVNLALGAAQQVSGIRTGTNSRYSILDTRYCLLDPFCGSGTVLMEAALMDQRLKLIGSDIEERQVADTMRNMDWMVHQHLISQTHRDEMRFFAHDVRMIDRTIREPIELVVTEGLLGTPLKGHEMSIHLEKDVMVITQLWRDTLTALAKIQLVGEIIVAIWPSFSTSHAEARVDLSNEVQKFGYEMVDPLAGWHVHPRPIVYARHDQHVQRQIVVLKRI